MRRAFSLSTMFLIGALAVLSPLRGEEKAGSAQAAPKGWAVVDASGASAYATIESALAAGEPRIFVKNGTYPVSRMLVLDRPHLQLRGESAEGVRVVMTDRSQDLLVIRADHVKVSKLTLDCRTYQARAAVVEANANHVTLEHCTILGSSDCFAVFFAGRNVAAGQDTLDAVERNDLDFNNTVQDNEVYSDADWDVLVFALQARGKVVNNTVHGGLLAFYLCNESVCAGNTILDSNRQGIAYSLPGRDNRISHNRILRSQASGIWVARNQEHPLPDTYRGQGLVIEGNTISSTRYMGLELSNVTGAVVSGNAIENTDFTGFYLLRADGTVLKDNTVTDAGQAYFRTPVYGFPARLSGGIFMDYQVTATQILENHLLNTDQGGARFGIRSMAGNQNQGAVISGNWIQGSYPDGAILVDALLDAVGENRLED